MSASVDKPTAGRWVLFAFTLSWTLVTWLLGVLSIACYIAHKPRFEGAGVLTLELREWFATGEDGKGPWKYSTTLGRTIWWQPGKRDPGEELDERIERHERIHVRQVEDLMVLSFIVGLICGIATGDWLLAFLTWMSGGLWQLPNFLTAMLRYGFRSVYRDSEHERSAYAQTDKWPNGESWWEERDRARHRQVGL